MKKRFWFLGCLGLSFCFPAPGRSDVIEKEIRSSDGKSSTTGYVYQRDTSSRSAKRSSTRRDPVIPSDSGSAQVTPLSEFTDPSAPESSNAKPRFGYGSDYRAETEPRGKEVVPPREVPSGQSQPVPPAHYPDPEIPSVPSYSDPRPATPQPDPPSGPQPPVYRDGQWHFGESPPVVPDSSPVPRDYGAAEDEPWFDDEIALSIPLPFGMSRSESGMFPFGVPGIEFRVDPPVHREFWPVLPHFFDPHCSPRVPGSFHSPTPPNLPFPVPFFSPFGR